MPLYRVTLFYKDERNGVTEKSYMATYADEAAALAARAAIVNASQAISGSQVYKSELTLILEYAGAPAVGSRVTDRMSASVYLDQATNKKYNLLVPSPLALILTAGNTLNSGVTEWQAYIDALTAAGAGWQVSDGENVDNAGANGTIGGKLITVRSGVRTLPTG